MREIKYIVVHCTATDKNATVESIQRYWRQHLRWKSPGYHYIVRADGHQVQLQDEELPANGVKGYNANSIHVSYIGGVHNGQPKDTRTFAQVGSMLQLLRELKRRYPEAVIQGHRDFPGVSKACPSFDAKSEYSNI